MPGVALSAACLVLLAAAAGGGAAARAQVSEDRLLNREYTIKAAYLYNFAHYVQWPAGALPAADTPLVIGVLGTDPFGAILDTIAAEKRVENRKIIVRRFPSLGEYNPCHILFIPRSTEPQQQLDVLRRLHGAGVLLVGEAPSFAERGGVVNFFIEQNKVRFEINPEAARGEQLKISSKLLSLAKIVGQGT